MLHIRVLGGLALAGALLLGTAASAGAASTTRIRVLHASPDAPAVDVWVDGSKVLADLAFKHLSGYLTIPAGAHHIVVVATGTTSPAVIDATPAFEAGKSYTVAAIGKLAAIKAAIFTDDAIGVAGSARLRVIHLSPDAPAVDVAVKGQTPAQAPVKALTFPNATGYLSLAPGTYDFQVRPAGTTTVALPLAGVKLAAGTNYTVFAVGLAASEAPAAQALTAVVGLDAVAVPVTSTDPIPAGRSSLPILLGLTVLGFATGLLVALRPGMERRSN